MHQGPLVRLIFGLFSLLLTLAAHGFVAMWALRFAPVRRHRRLVWATALGFVLAVPATRILAKATRADWAGALFAAALTEGMLVVFASVPLGLALAAGQAGAKVRAKPKKTGAELARRRLLEGAAGTLALGGTGCAFGWGMARGRHAFEIEEVLTRLPGLPRVLDGYTIAQISDLHVGTFVGERELAEGLSRVDEIRPDLLVVTGDLIDFDPGRTPQLVRFLRSVRARDGVVAILGNHDYYSGVPEILATLRAGGIDVLVNAGKTVRPLDGGGFALLGVDDLWARRSGGDGPDLTRALSMVPPDVPRILLAHQPAFFEQACGQVALQLSGHTHGGQINPGFRPIDLFSRYVSGRYERTGSTLWVNRGFGVVGPPVRLGAPPEVTRIVLASA